MAAKRERERERWKSLNAITRKRARQSPPTHRVSLCKLGCSLLGAMHSLDRFELYCMYNWFFVFFFFTSLYLTSFDYELFRKYLYVRDIDDCIYLYNLLHYWIFRLFHETDITLEEYFELLELLMMLKILTSTLIILAWAKIRYHHLHWNIPSDYCIRLLIFFRNTIFFLYTDVWSYSARRSLPQSIDLNQEKITWSFCIVSSSNQVPWIISIM